MGGKAAFSVGDAVAFRTRLHELEGTVVIVDCRRRESACFENCDWSYDIMVERNPDTGNPCMYKHIPECRVRRMD